jgi:hypothetical protein
MPGRKCSFSFTSFISAVPHHPNENTDTDPHRTLTIPSQSHVQSSISPSAAGKVAGAGLKVYVGLAVVGALAVLNL